MIENRAGQDAAEPPTSRSEVAADAVTSSAPDPAISEEEAREPAAPGQDPDSEEASAEEDPAAFGDQAPTRFAADVAYRGRAGEHDYLVQVRHRLLDTSFTVVIDGVSHDPKAEIKAGKKAEKKAEEKAEEDTSPGSDGLCFALEDGFTTQRCTVRRPRGEKSAEEKRAEEKSAEEGDSEEKGDGGEEGFKNAEVLTITTAGLGGAGEVEVRHGFQRTVLLPEDGSPSAVRDAKRTAHPTRFALIAALAKSARFLIPLLGLGALFSGLLEPVEQWVTARVRPMIDAIARWTAPIREWIDQLLQPVREFLDAVFSPVREFLAALTRPVRDLLDWLLSLVPDIGLPNVPDWVLDLLLPVIVLVAVFLATRRALRERREKLAQSREASAVEPDEEPATSGDGENEGRAVPTRGERDAEDHEAGPDEAQEEESREGRARDEAGSGTSAAIR
ncbi:hypothetical protein [Brachybacterium sp.]|uniref:hypothetical protein n=1 Tax=Brachybacterium sp. TaxID=1891286 RepID=UPI002ED51005